MNITPSLFQLEKTLYDNDEYCWSIYTALKKAPEDHRKTLWGLLTDQQKDEIRTLRRAAK